jgi:hypothetical protein
MARRTLPTPPGPRALAALLLVALVVLGAATATPWGTRPPRALLDAVPGIVPEISPLPTPSVTENAEPPADAGTTDLALVLLIVLLLIVAVVLALVGRRILAALRGAEPPPEPDTTDVGRALTDTTAPAVAVDKLQDAVTLALRRLDDAATAHDAVVAAWVSLEEAAAHHGTARDPAQTPTEFTVALLHDTPAPPGHVATLRRLYHHARFTDRPVDTSQVATARDALEHIARTLDERDPAPRRTGRTS